MAKLDETSYDFGAPRRAPDPAHTQFCAWSATAHLMQGCYARSVYARYARCDARSVLMCDCLGRACAVKENDAFQSVDDIDDFEARLAGRGAPRQPMMHKPPPQVPQRRPPAVFANAPVKKLTKPVKEVVEDEEGKFDDANAMADLDRFDAMHGDVDDD